MPDTAIPLPTTRTNPLDPPPELDRLRDDSPICRLAYPDGHVGWLVTSHELARSILGEKAMTIKMSMDRQPVPNDVRHDAFDRLAREGNRRVVSGYAGNFLNMDPPEHTRFRRLLAAEFAPKQIAAMRPGLERMVSEQIDSMTEHGSPIDLVHHFAEPIPSLAICEILGVPNEVRGHFQAWSTILEDQATEPDDLADAYHEFTEFLYDLVENPTSLPPEALIPRLTSLGELSVDEIVGIGVLLVAAGHQTVANQIAFSLYALLTEREMWEAIRDNPGSIPNAVEELLRYLTIFQLGALTRTATADIEVGDVTIRTGDSINVSLAAANRDPKKFPDPDELNLERRAIGHVSFGHGIHACLGQHLARTELELSLSGLAERLPTLTLALAPDGVKMHPANEAQAGPEELMVTW